MSLNNRKLRDLRLIYRYLELFYESDENQSYLNYFRDILNTKPDKRLEEDFSKHLIQYLLKFNLTILISEGTSSFRHLFPTKFREHRKFLDISQQQELGIRNNLQIEFKNPVVIFFELIKDIFKKIKINITLEISKDPKYFYIRKFQEILWILFFWDRNWIEFPKKKIDNLKSFFKRYEVFVYTNKNFMDIIFGDNGIIKKQNIPVSKFFNEIFNLSGYSRHAIYKWRNDNYFPASVLYDLYNSRYRSQIDLNLLKNIKYIKIGKAQIIQKETFDIIRNNYEDKFSLFIPATESMLGYLLTNDFDIIYNDKDILNKYNKYLNRLPSEILKNNEEIIKFFKKNLEHKEEGINLKSIKICNFKSHLNTTVNFQRGINIIYGLNESGKSSILEAIFFALFLLEAKTNIRLKRIYPLELEFLDTHFIKVGEEYCKVELEIIRKSNVITISRTLWKDGRHEIKINNKNVISEIDPRQFLFYDRKFMGDILKGTNKSNEIEQKLVDVEKLNNELKIKGYLNFEIVDTIDEIVIEPLHSDEENQGDNLHLYFGDDVDTNLYLKQATKSISKYYSKINYTDLMYKIYNEIRDVYKEIGCPFEKDNIFTPFFIQSESIMNFLKYSPYKTIEFYKKKLKLNFLNNIKVNNKEQMDFAQKSGNYIIKTYLDYINFEFKKYSNELLNIDKKKKAHCYLNDYGMPFVKLSEISEEFPFSILSGSERSKIILLLISLLIKSSAKNTFYLIDEPNELLDNRNIKIIREYFLKLFSNTQLIICTFIENYKNFQPAVIYEVWKDRNNISHVFQLEEDKKDFELYKKKDELEKKIEENPKDYYYNQKKLVLLITSNLYEEALKYFQSIKDLSLDVFNIEGLGSSLLNIVKLEKVRKESNENEAEFYRTRALIYHNLKELHQAIKDIDEAIKIGPKMPEIYNFKARNLRYANKPKRALEAIEEGIRLFPKYTGFYSVKSEILEALGRNEEALQDINKAIEIDNDEYWVFYKKAYILNKLERYEEALVDINKAIEFEPHDFVLINDKLSILQNLNRIDEAIKLLNQENKNSVFSPDAFKQVRAQLLRDKAYNLMESGEKDEAIKMIKEAIELQPDWPEYIQPYGEILMHFREYKAALEQLEKADSLPFRPLETPIQIGICLYKLGRYNEALESLNLGINYAKYSEKSTFTTDDDGKTVTVDAPQTELIRKAEKYILEVEKKIKEIE